MGRPQLDEPNAGSELPTRCLFDGFEVVQAVQEPLHSVTLVAGKRTLVRLYISVEANEAVRIRGSLELNNVAGSETVTSSNTVTVDPTNNRNTQSKREDLALSLNFEVPRSLTAAGELTVRLHSLTDADSGVPAEISGAQDLSVRLESVPPLRLRLLGIRYRTRGSSEKHVPSQTDVDLILSWLERAYPVASVDASYVVVDANRVWPFRAYQVNAQVAAIRNQDVANGTDNRTHYYGLVSDAGNRYFMRGQAGIPSRPNPAAVGSGPTGARSWGWDYDGSYGDWYAGHELAHTFGRRHPGFCNGNSRDDPRFPNPRGLLTGTSPAYVGFDVGDSANGVSQAALPGSTWHDVMTYCSNQWMSAYTYEGIRERLIAEDALGGGSGSRADHTTKCREAPIQLVNVIAILNLTKGSGEFAYVNPIAHAGEHHSDVQDSADKTTPSVYLRALDASGKMVSQQVPEVTPQSCADAGAEQMAMIDTAIPVDDRVAALELVANGTVVDRFAPGPPPSDVANVRRETTADDFSALRWDSAEAADPTVTYQVQVSTDGTAWQTIAIGQQTPEVDVDWDQFAPADSLDVRVTATNGFRVTSSAEAEVELD